MVKHAKFGREIFIQLKINQAEMKCDVRKIIIVTCVTYVQKDFLDLNFNQAVIVKISIFHTIDPNFTYSQKS